MNDNTSKVNGEVNDFTGIILDRDLYLTNLIVTDNERLLITIDSPGGSGKTMKHIIKSIKASEVPVDTYVPDFAASAGAITFIMGEHRYVDKGAQILFHGAHLGTYALTEPTIQRAADLLESGELERLMFLKSTGQLKTSDVDIETFKAVEVASAFLEGSGLSGLQQVLLSTLEGIKAANKVQVQTVTDQLQKVDTRYTYEVVKKEFFGDFKVDVYFTGQQLIDMGIAEEYKHEKN